MDPRNTKLAEQLITYSVKLQPGEKIYLEIKGPEALELGRELVRVATLHGGAHVGIAFPPDLPGSGLPGLNFTTNEPSHGPPRILQIPDRGARRAHA